MSGGNVSYNLRPNKFVERQLFVELLSILCVDIPVDQIVYVSMGGPQLEDHRLIHQRLGYNNLISLESDEIVYQRQIFNLRPSYIKCSKSSVSDFVSNFDNFYSDFNEHRKIIWFDYASPKERLEQLSEFETILGQLEDGDILKITMNAHPNTLGEMRKGESPEDIQDIRREALIKQLNSIIPSDIKSEEVSRRNLPGLLANAVKTVSIRALQSYKGFTALPLGIFVYQDGPHQMLTVTVRITARNEINAIREKLNNGGWQYLPEPSNWQNVLRIDVPNLSAKERFHTEEKLFTDSFEEVHANLPFRFHSNETISLGMLKEYAQHYRRYPSYFQVIL